MQFIEYYQIIRERIWLALLTMALGASIVIAIQLLPAGSYTAEGKLYVSPNAQQEAQQSGNDVAIGGLGDDFWQTFQDAVSSRYVIEEAAKQIGIVGPDIVKRLAPLVSDRPRRSRLLLVMGSGGTADQAKQLTDRGMEVICKYWNENRLTHLRQIRSEVDRVLQDAKARADAAQVEVRRLEVNGLRMGRPTDTLMWAQQEINTIDGQLASAKIEEGLAQDRITSLNAEARRQAALPPAERAYTTPQSPTASLDAQLTALQTQRSELLLHRTPQHPMVRRLDEAIAALQKQIADAQKKAGSAKTAPGAPTGAPPALQEQLLSAQLSLQESQRRTAALVQRQAQLRGSIPLLQDQATKFAEVANTFAEAKAAADNLAGKVKLLDAEERRLQDEQDVSIFDKAQVQTSSKVKSKFLAKFLGATVGGLLVGIIFIFMLHNLDMTFKDELEAEQMIGAKVLTAIPRSDVVLREEYPDVGAALPPQSDAGADAGAGLTPPNL